MLNPSPDACIDSLFESTPRVDVPVTTTVVPLLVTAPTLPPPSIPIMSQVQQAPAPTPTTAPSSFLLRDEAQAENEDFLNKLDENIQKIIKEQVKVQVSKILPKIKKTVNEQLKAKVLTRASNSSKTSYDVAVDLSEMELKKILIEKMESKKSYHRSDEQRNLYKALVDAYECEKIILDTHRYTITLKRRRGDEDKDEEPSAGLDRGPTPQGAAVVAVPSSDRHHDGGLAADSPYSTPNQINQPPDLSISFYNRCNYHAWKDRQEIGIFLSSTAVVVANPPPTAHHGGGSGWKSRRCCCSAGGGGDGGRWLKSAAEVRQCRRKTHSDAGYMSNWLWRCWLWREVDMLTGKWPEMVDRGGWQRLPWWRRAAVHGVGRW
nr:hypothetical protein [Tanacetum cinerariifolium]